MNYDRYKDLTVSLNKATFAFTSIGPNGSIRKAIIYEEIPDEPSVYNLSLATINSDNQADFADNSRNHDINKILATVAYKAYVFVDTFPERKIFFMGSDAARTRKYQQAINHAYDEISETFIVKGIIITEDQTAKTEFFERNKNYDAFLFEKK